MKLQDLKKEIEVHTISKKGSDRFTKTGKGYYGHGLKFLKLKLNTLQLRKIAKKYSDLRLSEVKKLLFDPYQQLRLIGYFILVEKFKTTQKRKEIVDFYLENLKALNNWDLVDSSAHQILGEWLKNKKSKKILYKLAKSKNLWKERVAIVATYPFIKAGDLEDTFQISEILFSRNKHDLIHKATGWMLREVGKQNQTRLEVFLKKHIRKIPRTTLRYAIERFEEKKRKKFLKL